MTQKAISTATLAVAVLMLVLSYQHYRKGGSL